MADNRLKTLRMVAWIEGISYLVLLFVAMPLKYLADMPEVVRYTGLVHGLLFTWFVISVIQAKIEHSWKSGFAARLVATAFVPFGMIWFDRMVTPPPFQGDSP